MSQHPPKTGLEAADPDRAPAAPEGLGLLDHARKFVRVEAEAVAGLVDILDENFLAVIALLARCPGRIVTTGMGKAGLIARKAAATFASTGAPAYYVHPAESLHGDLGMITGQDVVMAFSHRGATEELLRMVPYLKYIGTPLVLVTSNGESELARQSDLVLNLRVEREACPLNLAPTASTTAMLALADTLALTLLQDRGFGPEDFAVYHPGGALGRRLLTRVADLMHSAEDNPVVAEVAPVREAILQMTSTKMAAASIIDGEGRLAGFFTDGDLRRYLMQGGSDLAIPVGKLMTRNPKRVRPETMAVKALEILREHKIIELPVVDEDQHPVGIIHLHDITRAGII